MSVNIHFTLRVDKLRSLDEAASVREALAKILREQGIEREVTLRKFREPISVKATTGKWPLSVRRFGDWSKAFEREVTEAVRGVAPSAAVGLDWGYPD
ncbi:hypothetical protein [Streptomyces sp. NPDC006645]|uniref:hypothetical protein n=1 Tax=unclassified Streptomyces TaxID=2593676 RepID=UPI00339E9CE9